LRGVIAHANTRNVSPKLDEEDHRALKEVMSDLEPLLTWHA
jgi:hypothetical protein